MLLLAEEMDPDEVVAMLAGAAGALVIGVMWYLPMLRATRLGRRRAAWGVKLAPPLAMAILLVVLVVWSAVEVRTDWRYILLFMAVGAAWLGWVIPTGLLAGLSARHHVIEQRNHAADNALGGAVMGFGVSFACANIGEGPTIWTTIGPALLAAVGLAALWIVVEILARVSDAITIDRDLASGWRLGAFLIAAGLVLGRAVAGDWVSVDDTLNDFVAYGWPAAALAAVAIGLQWAEKPRPTSPTPSLLWCGVLPSAAMLVGAGAWVWYLGPW